MAQKIVQAQIQGGDTGVNVGDSIAVDFLVSTDDGSKIASLDFQALYNSNELKLVSAQTNNAGGAPLPLDTTLSDTSNRDNDPDTNSAIKYGILDLNDAFPSSQGVSVFTANFTVEAAFDGNTSINVAPTDPDAQFTGTPLALTLDVDEAPVVADPIEDLTVEEDDNNTEVPLAGVFSDPDGDPITYAVTSSDTTKIVATIDTTDAAAPKLVLDYQQDAFGDDIAITVTATANGKSVSDDFLVDITESKAPELTSADGKTIDVGGTDGNIEYQVKQVSSPVVSDIGFYEITTDDTTGATTNGADQLILSTLGAPPTGFTNIDLSRIVSALEGDKLGFFVTTNPGDNEDAEAATFRSTDENSRITIADIDADGALDIQFANEDGSTAFIISSLGIEESSTADTNIEDGSAVIDLTGDTGTINFTVDVFNQASYNNIIGVYNIDALTGENLTPGVDGFDSEAYVNAALDNLTGSTLTIGAGDGQAVNDAAISLTGGSRYGIFVITNIDLESEDGEANAVEDARNGDLEIYFPFLGANGDEASHIKLLGDNTFGIEDLNGGGDQDFNDVVLNFSRTSAA